MRINTSKTERGQYITIAGLILAIIIISAVAIGNVGVQSTADRQAGPTDNTESISDIVETSEKTATAGFSKANTNPDFSTSEIPSEVENSIELSLETYDENLKYSGNTVTVENIDASTSGYRIVQTQNRGFEIDGSGDFTLVSNADAIRKFNIEITEIQESEMAITLQGDGESEEIVISQPSPNQFLLEYDTASGADSCTVETGTLTADLIGGAVEERSCGDYPALEVVEAIEIQGGNNAQGSYSTEYLGSDSDANSEISDENSPPPETHTGDPVGHEIVYSATVDLSVTTPSGSEQRSILVAPGGVEDPLATERSL